MDRDEQAAFYISAAVYLDLGRVVVDRTLGLAGLDVSCDSLEDCRRAVLLAHPGAASRMLVYIVHCGARARVRSVKTGLEGSAIGLTRKGQVQVVFDRCLFAVAMWPYQLVML